MQWKKLRIIGASGSFAIAVLMFSIWLSSSGNESEKQALGENTGQDVSEQVLPEYLAFETVIEAGGSYSVENSTENEFFANDEDNELKESSTNSSKSNSDEENEEDDAEIDEELAFVEESKKEIKGSIEPGFYVTPLEVKDCSYELWRVMEDGSEQLIGSDYIKSGRLIVSINAIEPDRFYSSEGCLEWSSWTPIAEPMTQVKDGDFWVQDLEKGTWQVGKDCRWERVIDFRGAKIFDSVGSGIGPGKIGIGDEDLGLRIRGCKTPMKFLDSKIAEEHQYVESDYQGVVEGYARNTRRRS